MRGVVAKLAVLFGRSAGWSKITDQMRGLLFALFKGWGQTKVVEDCIKALRERETRDANKKDLGMWASWSGCVESDLIAKYDREEVDVTVGATVKSEFNGALFSLSHASNGDGDSVDLRGIMRTQSWPSPNTTSTRQLWAQQQLFLVLHRENLWDQAMSAQYVSLLPEGEFVLDRKTSDVFLVVKTLSVAAIVWLAKNISHDAYALDLEARELHWKAYFSLEGLEVLPVEPCSPLHLRVARRVDGDSFVFRSTGLPLPVLDWQVTNGFPHVGETTLRMLCDDEGIDTTAPLGLTDVPVTFRLALLLIQFWKADLTPEEAMKILLSRTVKEDTLGCAVIDDLDDEAIADVVLLGDQVQSREFLKRRAKAVTERHNLKVAAQTTVHRLFPAHALTVAPARSKAKERANANALATEMTRWVEKLHKDPVDALMDDKPLMARVHVDVPSGRFRCFYKGFKDRSFSWTLRGQPSAVRCALRQMWEWNDASTGSGIPLHLVLDEAP